MAKESKPRAGKKDQGTKAAKAKKDPNAPKRPLSAYMFFSQENRATVKEENPEASFGDLGKLLGAKWKEMDDDEKKPFVKQANDDKARYETEKEAYDSKAAKAKPAKKDEDDDEDDKADESDE
ncbi:high mobility group box domain-containing protein [Leucosporidium creatinivorum]|uniref:High mobility group box domain-containing protein n=1 Tax=Leucosporidium creatinivorum TaxID=106004 RepID=A0A1Y2FPQ8_9BASI|nr:high mobility group box domain-containing protein [Leucosporidium creatinivorum]